MRDLPTGTITLLFTDIEGSTHLLQRIGERYAELLDECRTILRAAFSAHHGYEVDTQGDAMFAVFVRASDALHASVAAQRDLALHAWPGAVEVRVRMGLHTGEPSRVAEGYVGLGRVLRRHSPCWGRWKQPEVIMPLPGLSMKKVWRWRRR